MGGIGLVWWFWWWIGLPWWLRSWFEKTWYLQGMNRVIWTGYWLVWCMHWTARRSRQEFDRWDYWIPGHRNRASRICRNWTLWSWVFVDGLCKWVTRKWSSWSPFGDHLQYNIIIFIYTFNKNTKQTCNNSWKMETYNCLSSLTVDLTCRFQLRKWYALRLLVGANDIQFPSRMLL